VCANKYFDRHFKRVIAYARPSDYAHGAAAAAVGPGLLLAMEKFAPSQVGKGGFAQAMRLGGFLGVAGGFLYFYQRSIRTFTPAPAVISRFDLSWKKATCGMLWRMLGSRGRRSRLNDMLT
jgi:hypothetical protein